MKTTFSNMTDDELSKYLKEYAAHRDGEISELTYEASLRIAVLSARLSCWKRKRGIGMKSEEINRMKYIVCCPMCDKEKCVRKTDKCEAEIWAKNKTESECEG